MTGVFAIMTSLHKSNQNIRQKSVKLDTLHNKDINLNSNNFNLNIQNINYSLKDNKSNLNSIGFNSEEATLGFKNLYSLGSIPNKILKSQRRINNIKYELISDIKKRNKYFINLKKSIITNKVISYSNYINNLKVNLFSNISFTNIVSNSNKSNNFIITARSNNKIKNKIIFTAEGGVLVVLSSITMGIPIFRILRRISNRIRNSFRNNTRVEEANHSFFDSQSSIYDPLEDKPFLVSSLTVNKNYSIQDSEESQHTIITYEGGDGATEFTNNNQKKGIRKIWAKIKKSTKKQRNKETVGKAKKEEPLIIRGNSKLEHENNDIEESDSLESVDDLLTLNNDEMNSFSFFKDFILYRM